MKKIYDTLQHDHYVEKLYVLGSLGEMNGKENSFFILVEGT
jgi:hypothetical protein